MPAVIASAGRGGSTASTGGAGFFFFLLKLGVPNMSGAKNPACKANSAKAFPDGNLQLNGSIHSIGTCGIRMGEIRWPPPLPGGVALRSFIQFSVCSHY
jgi:hypothetical protein